MDLRRWTHVVAVAERRSFIRAAEQVHLSQPALTRSIQAAEAELGLRLFDRGTQEVVPTPAGAFVIARARQLVFDSRCLERDVELYRHRGLGDTAFGVGPFPAATFLAPLLAGVRREFPGIKLRVEVSNWQLLVQRLREEDIEFFVADTRDLPSDPVLQVRPLRHEPGGFYVRAGHPLGARRSVTLQQLWSHGVASVRVNNTNTTSRVNRCTNPSAEASLAGISSSNSSARVLSGWSGRRTSMPAARRRGLRKARRSRSSKTSPRVSWRSLGSGVTARRGGQTPALSRDAWPGETSGD